MTDRAEAPQTTKVREEDKAYDIESLLGEFREYGLTPNEVKVFLQLSRFGPDTASGVSRSLGLPRTEVYGIISGLQSKGLVEASLDRPAKFSVLPIQRSLNLLIEAQRNKVETLERSKERLLQRWEMMHIPPPEGESEKLQLLKGSELIYARVSEMVERATGKVDIVAFGPDLIRLLGAGALRNVRQLRKKKLAIRVLTDDGHRSREALSWLEEYAQVQRTEPPPSFVPHFIIVDESEVLMFTKSPGRSPAGRREATALWTNGHILVQSMIGLFREMQGRAAAKPSPQLERTTATARSELLEMKKRLVRELSMIGLDAKENLEVSGKSGVTHRFDLGATVEGSKPMAVDLALDVEEVGVVPVIAFFAKKRDVESSVSNATLVVKPKLSSSARELAQSYGIRVVELHS
jgi:sugar-specific transcriptional regulator TrmB